MARSQCIKEPRLAFQWCGYNPFPVFLVHVYMSNRRRSQKCKHEELASDRCPDSGDVPGKVSFTEYSGCEYPPNSAESHNDSRGDASFRVRNDIVGGLSQKKRH